MMEYNFYSSSPKGSDTRFGRDMRAPKKRSRWKAVARALFLRLTGRGGNI